MEMRLLVVVSALLVLVPVLHTEGAKVLLLPMVGASHTINFAQIGDALIKQGHQVTAYMNGDCEATKRLSKVNIDLITYNNTVAGCLMESEEITDIVTKVLEDGNLGLMQIIPILKSRYPLFKAEVEHALADKQAIRKMKRIDFDVIVVDGLPYNKHLYVLAHILGKPIVSVMTVFSPYEAGVPTIPSLYPLTNAGVTAKMTFLERLKNLGMLTADRFFLPFVLPTCDNNLVVKYSTDRPYKSISQIAGETRVWLVMSDNVIDYAKVTVPSIVNIGGLNTKPADPLTGDLKAWADAADAGLIIVSFGSQFILPERIIKVFLDSFRGLPQTIIMRHTDTSVKDVPENVHFVKWMPQNDLLGHPNTRLFITHCGCNGQFEGLYHGVPMIGLPLIGDQIHNAKRAEYHGIGITLKVSTLTKPELSGAISKILGDPAYSKQIHRLSGMFRDRPMTPMQTAVYWIEHVVKYGGEELRPASVDLPSYQFWALDIMAFVIVILSVLTYVMCKFCCCLCRCCCTRKPTEKPTVPKTTQKNVQKTTPKAAQKTSPKKSKQKSQ